MEVGMCTSGLEVIDIIEQLSSIVCAAAAEQLRQLFYTVCSRAESWNMDFSVNVNKFIQ